MMKAARILIIAAGLAFGHVVTSQGAAPEPLTFKIEAQPLASALNAFSRQAGLQVIQRDEEVSTEGLLAPRVVGKYTPEQALELLLANTAITFEFINDHTVRLSRASSPPIEQSGEGPSTLEEVIVTAQKREQRLQDVPVTVSVLGGNQLADNGLTNIRDYALEVPGLSVTPYYAGAQSLAIRGISTGGFDSGTVALAINGVFFPISILPDLDPGDLQRIEILKGPQGTLFGTSSEGGVINYVTANPDPSHFFGRIQSGVSRISNGSSTGFEARGMLNIPLAADSAVRVSGFDTRTPGFIDNPSFGLHGVNTATSDGASLDAVLRPWSAFSVRLAAIYQRSAQTGLTEVDELPGLGDLQQNYIPGTGGSSRTIQAYSATLSYKLGRAELTSVTGYNSELAVETLDDTPNVGALTALVANGATGSAFRNNSSAHHFIEELRASVPVTNNAELLLGGYYRDSQDREEFQFFATNPPSPRQLLQTWDNYNLPVITHEYAIFGNLTYHFSPRFDVQVGLRESRLTTTQAGQYSTGPFNPLFISADTPTTTVFAPGTESSSNTLTYLFTPEYKITSDVMVYARFASGFRPGGANNTGVPGIPPKFNPDQTHNYEMGLKGDFFGHTLNIDTSVYYIDWSGIQFNVRGPQSFFYTANAGSAKSEGLELAATWKPFEGTQLSGWIDFDDAVLTKTVDSSVYLAAGERLPNVSRWSGHMALNKSFPLRHDLTGFAGVEASYVGSQLGLFQPVRDDGAAPPRQSYAGYVRTDLRAGVDFKSWAANLYINNLADIHTNVGGGLGNIFPYAFVPLQPRMIGMNVTARF